MSQQDTELNTDTENVKTSASHADAGDGVTRWFHWNRTADGGHATTGLKADAAVIDPTASGSVIALLKGLLTFARVSAAGILKAEDAVAASGDSGVMALAVRRDTAVADGADGDYAPVHVDVLGRLQVTQPKPSRIANTALAASLVVKASAGRLFRLVITNTNGAARFFQVHNTASLPADGQVPVISISVAAGASFVLDLGSAGDAYSTGITVCNSTTAATKTIGAADAWVTAYYE